MRPVDLARCAWQAQRTYALRATLALLGIAAGVATVLLALAAATGARERAVRDLGTLGPDAIVVRPESPDASGHAITTGLASALATTLARDVTVAALRHASREVTHGGATAHAAVLGVSNQWPGVSGVTLASGRWFNPEDDRSRRRVVVLGHDLADGLAPGALASGDWVRLGTEWFRVIGVLAARRAAVTSGMVSAQDLDRACVVPLETLPSAAPLCEDCVDELVLRGAEAPRQVAALTRTVLRRLVRPADPAAPGYTVVVAEELLQARLAARRTGDLLLLVMGALALAIGGIGTTNILLAHISERTAEIGVRRAVGATRRDIIAQVGLESVLLCSVGALAGVTAGVAAAAIVARLAGWEVLVSPGAVAIALASAFVVGVLAGVLPARRAGTMTPSAALREE